MKIQLTEGLRYMDMENQVFPVVGIDRYKSSIGTDDDLITLDFTVKGKQVARDLSEWLERGYDWVIDADISTGEVQSGKYLVFAEINRRTSGPKQIIEMLEDLETLTGLTIDQWKIAIDDKKYPANEETIKNNLILIPHEYREKHKNEDDTLNEWREIAGVSMTTTKTKEDPAITAIKRQAGLI